MKSHAKFQLQQGSGEGGKLGGGCPRALTYSAFLLSAEVPLRNHRVTWNIVESQLSTSCPEYSALRSSVYPNAL